MKKRIAAAVLVGTVLLFTLAACFGLKLELVGENTRTAPVQPSAGAGTLTVMTYNVKNCDLGAQIEPIAEDIRRENPDVVCVQEIDQYVRRSGKRAVLEELAQAVQMNYYFYPAISLQGGSYGIGIMSVYPLESCEVIPLETRAEDEARVLAKAVIQVDGQPVTIFNTHLSFEDTQQRRKQWDFLQTQLDAAGMPAVLTGDFNVAQIGEFSYLHGVTAINNSRTPYETFIGEGDEYRCLDNIFISGGLMVSSCKMGETSASDHNPLIAVLRFQAS